MGLKSLLWILLLNGILSGCSYTSFIYNNAPWLIREKVDDYFSLTSTQERQLNLDIDSFFKWHRYQELPQYASMITVFNNQFVDGLTREELISFFEQVAKAQTRSIEFSLDSTSLFLANISREQLEHFDREFQQLIDDDLEKTSLPIEQLNEENFSQLLDSLEDWFGAFDEDQQRLLRAISDNQPQSDLYILKRRENRHQSFIKFMRGNPDAPSIKAFLHNRFVKGTEQGVDHQKNEARQFWLSAILSIDKIITNSQRRQAINRLDDYRQDFIYMSQLGPEQLQIKVER